VPYLCLEILLMSLQHQPNYLISHLTSETQKVLKYPLLNYIMDNVANCNEFGL
jgi:hypothetical protein